MKHFAAAAVAVLLSAAAAHADPFSSAYGNTVTVTAPDGKKQINYVNQDGTWEQREADGSVMKGTFVWKDATTACFAQTDPVPSDPSKATGCQTIKGDHKVGDTWTETDEKGQAYTITITAGR